MSYEQEKKFLAETAAIRVSYWSNPQTGNAVLVRRWTTSRAELQSSCFTYLNTIKTVKDPVADKVKYPGTWRVFPNQAPQKKGLAEDQQGITQTLVLSVDGDFKWASEDSTLECMYSYAYQNQAAPIQTKVAVQGEVTEVQNTLNDQLQYDSQARIIHSHPYQWTTHTGEDALGTTDNIGYKNARTRPEAPVSTKQGTIYDAKSTLNKDGSYDGDVLYKTSRPVDFTIDTGKSSTNAESTKVLVNQTAAIAAPASSQGVQTKANSSINPDGTYSGAQITDTSTALSVTADTEKSSLINESTIASVNSRTKLAAAVAGVGVQTRARNNINPDGTYSGEQITETSVAANWSDETQTAVGSTVSNSYLNYRTKPSAPSSLAIGFVYDARTTLNKDGTYNGGVGYEYSKPAMWSDEVRSAVGYSVNNSYLNYRTKPTAPASSVQGFIYDAKSTLVKDGTYSGDVGYEYSLPVMMTSAVHSTLSSGYSTDYLNYRTKPVAPSGTVQGFVYDAQSTLNKDGTYNGGVNYEYSKPIMLADQTESALATSYDLTYLSYRTRPTAPSTSVQGFIYDAKSTLNKDGTYSGGAGYECSKPLTWTDVTSAALGTSYGYSYANSRVRPVAPAVAVQGYVFDAKSTVNKDGTYSGGVGYEHSKTDQWADITEDALTIDYSISYLNSRERPTASASAAQGCVYDAKSTDNKDGTYNGGAGYSYSKPIEIASQTLSGVYTAAYEISYQNSRTKPVVPAATLGFVYDAKSTLAKDGTYNGGIGYEHDAPIEVYQTFTDRYGAVAFWSGKNCLESTFTSTLATASLDYMTNNDVNKEVTRSGLVNFMIVKRPYGLTNITTYYGTLGTGGTTVYDFERRLDADDASGYKWRKITIVLTEYVGIGLTAAWSNINDGDNDSIKPQFLGLVAGLAVYRSVKIKRTWNASWTTGATAES